MVGMRSVGRPKHRGKTHPVVLHPHAPDFAGWIQTPQMMRPVDPHRPSGAPVYRDPRSPERHVTHRSLRRVHSVTTHLVIQFQRSTERTPRSTHVCYSDLEERDWELGKVVILPCEGELANRSLDV